MSRAGSTRGAVTRAGGSGDDTIRINFGIAEEVDEALAATFTVGTVIALGIAEETDTALPITMINAELISFGVAEETDEALPMTLAVGAVINFGIAEEVDEALPLTVAITYTINFGIAEEVDEAFALVIEYNYGTTDKTNRFGGRIRRSTAIATWSPPLAPVPHGVVIHDKDRARAFGPVSFESGMPVYEITEVVADRHLDQILVGGVDVTFFREVRTPTPAFELIQPLQFGSGSLEFPQIWANFEPLGVGELAFLKHGAEVIVRRRDPVTGEPLEDDDYCGFIKDFDVRGRNLVCILAGEAAGRASMIDGQPALLRRTLDGGDWIYTLMPVPFRPRRGVVTGIKLPTPSGAKVLDGINSVAAQLVNEDGTQWTIGRRPDRAYGMWLKDTTTVHATAYVDTERVVLNVVDAMSERYNRIFATGIGPDGERYRNAKFPYLLRGAPAHYPFVNTATTFGIGTTDADTDYPDEALITVLIYRLCALNMMPLTDFDGDYDADVAQAVRRVQDRMNLPITGVMNLATWNTMFDVDAIGRSLRGARIDPFAQLSATRPWNYSASGAMVSRNPDHDPSLPLVDLSVNMGLQTTPQQLSRWSNGLLSKAASKNWVGTLTFNGFQLIAGDHTPGDPVTPEMLMSARALRAGMNIKVPNFDGGTIFHVSGVQIPRGGRDPQVTVDTRARDTMAAWEVKRRNRDSQYDAARNWRESRRSSQLARDAFIEWDAASGLIDPSSLRGGHWTIIEVIAAQSGRISKTRIRLNKRLRFAAACFAGRIDAGRLDHLVPNPLTEAGTARWDKAAIRNKLLGHDMVWQAGRNDQAGGYYPGMQAGDDGQPTGDPVTGVMFDDGGFDYYTGNEPILYLAIWVPEDARIAGGRVMWGLQEAI